MLLTQFWGNTLTPAHIHTTTKLALARKRSSGQHMEKRRCIFWGVLRLRSAWDSVGGGLVSHSSCFCNSSSSTESLYAPGLRIFLWNTSLNLPGNRMRVPVQRKKLRLRETKQPIQGPPAGKRGGQGTRADFPPLPVTASPQCCENYWTSMRSRLFSSSFLWEQLCFLLAPGAGGAAPCWRVPGMLRRAPQEGSGAEGPSLLTGAPQAVGKDVIVFSQQKYSPQPWKLHLQVKHTFSKRRGNSWRGNSISQPGGRRHLIAYSWAPVSGEGTFPKEAVPGRAAAMKQGPWIPSLDVNIHHTDLRAHSSPHCSISALALRVLQRELMCMGTCILQCTSESHMYRLRH